VFIVTNREVHEKGKRGIDRFGKKLNPEGANELRAAEAVRTREGWTVKILPDQLTPQMKREVGLQDQPDPVYSGQYAARKLLARVNPKRAREIGVQGVTGTGKNLLLFVHGFNNNVKVVLDRARSFETLYGVEVLPFSWPANGGGVSGVASYKSDKRDAKASIGALDRVLDAMQRMLACFNEDYLSAVRTTAKTKFEDDPERQDSYISTMSGRGCPFTVNAIFHSMGNYLYKHLLKSGSSEGTGLLFDNVVLAAADANNEDHASWVDRIRCRRRIYITINEDDEALAASRLKSGEEQKARLGHYSYGLDSRQGVYVQFTDVRGVGDSHAYFEGRPVAKNARIKTFFKEALNGKRAEVKLRYDSANNMYLFK
jgi:esterase/lipase superfamily enzyme